MYVTVFFRCQLFNCFSTSHLTSKLLALIRPLTFHQTNSYFDHLAQHCLSQGKKQASKTKVRKPWIRFTILRNVDIETIDTLLLVGLFPTLSDDYSKYTQNFNLFKSTITTKQDPRRQRMITHLRSILVNRYNPQIANQKPPKTVPREMKWISYIISGHEGNFPKCWFHLTWIYALAHFDENQCKNFYVCIE